jgi:hypothetical protein
MSLSPRSNQLAPRDLNKSQPSVISNRVNGRIWLFCGARFRWGRRARHAIGIEDFAQQFFVEQFSLEGDFDDGASGFDALLGDVGSGGGSASAGLRHVPYFMRNHAL